MPTRAPTRLPISTRHAFALAFDLALRRDLLHSLIVPLLLRTPWLLALALIPTLRATQPPHLVLAIAATAAVGDFITSIVIGATLRIRARSVFNTLSSTRPMPVLAAYAQGLGRVPWLIVTEVVRNVSLGFAWSFSILPAVMLRFREEALGQDLMRSVLLIAVAILLTLPGLYLGFRLAVATESVVLHEHDLAGAFIRSFHMMNGRFERWFELIVASALLVLAVTMFGAALTVLFPPLAGDTGIGLLYLLVVAVLPIIQYSWTFFYLRLQEIDEPSAAPPASVLPDLGVGSVEPRPELVAPVTNGHGERHEPKLD